MNGYTQSLIGKTPHKQRRAIALASGPKNARVCSCARWCYTERENLAGDAKEKCASGYYRDPAVPVKLVGDGRLSGRAQTLKAVVW